MEDNNNYDIVDLINKVEDENEQIKGLTQFDAKEFHKTVEKYSTKSSEYLAGVVGGIFGLSGGISMSILGGLSIISGPVAAILGAALGILIWRGKGQHDLERATKKYNIAYKTILDKYNNLPANTPEKVKEEYWLMLRYLNAKYTETMLKSINDDKSKFDKLLIEK